jgi:F-type H+-transporting ATPase subunit epsilon
MHLSLITPEKVVFSGEAEMIVIPGLKGYFGVLDRHAPFMTILQEGPVTLYKNGKPETVFTITGGFAEVTPEECVILADSIRDFA